MNVVNQLVFGHKLLEKEMVSRGFAALSLIVLVSACGGGSDDQIIDELTQGKPVEPTPLQSFIPTDRSRIVAFDSVNDDRIFRWLTADQLITTTYGQKTVDGHIDEYTGLTVEDDDGRYIEVEIADSGGEVSLRLDGASYTISQESVGKYIYRMEVGDQFVEYEIQSENGSSNNTSYGLTQRVQVLSKMRQEIIPFSTINIDGCSSEIHEISVSAYNDKGAYLNRFRVNSTADNEFEVLLPGLSTVDARVANFSSNVVEFLKEYEFSNVTQGQAVGLVVENVERLVERGISVQTDLIDALSDSESFFDRLGVTVPVDTVAPTLKRVALRGLKAILKYGDLPGLINQSLLAGEVVASAIDLASTVLFDQVAFEVVVTTNSGDAITSVRTELVSADGPYPFMSIAIPCLDFRPRSLIESTGSLFSTYDYVLDNGDRIVGSCSVPGSVSFPGFKLKLDENTASINSGFSRMYGPVESCFGDYIDPNTSHNLTLERVGNILVGSYGPAADRWNWNLFVSEDGKSITGKVVNSHNVSNPVGGTNTGTLTINVSLTH